MGVPSVSDVLSIPTRAGGITNGANSLAAYFAQQQQARQGLQLQQAQQLATYKMYANLSTDPTVQAMSPKIDAMLSQNPYGKIFLGQNMGQALSPIQQGQPQQDNSQQNLVNNQPQGQSQGMAPLNGSAGIQPLGGGVQSSNTNGINSPSMGFNANSLGNMFGGSNDNIITGGSTSQKFGEMPTTTTTFANPKADALKAQQTAIANANVDIPKSYATKMADSQALSQENLARDKTQMNAVMATLKNQRDLHVALDKKGLVGNYYGDMADTILPLIGSLPFGKDMQNAIISPNDQQKIGQFVSGRNEGITRAIQPLQNQVDKTGSNRISDTLLGLTEKEYGDLPDTRAMYDGKTYGTAQTLYRITLASQQYADMLKKKGIQLDGESNNFDPKAIANQIYDTAKSIQFTPTQQKEFDGYWKQISGGSGSLPTSSPQATSSNFNPLSNAKQPQQNNNIVPKFDSKTQKLQRNSRTGEYRVVSL